jgi:hypothetical protein
MLISYRGPAQLVLPDIGCKPKAGSEAITGVAGQLLAKDPFFADQAQDKDDNA